MSGETMISVFLGIGLAASAGFRVFVPLFALSIASYAGLWDLNENWQWMGSLSAVIIMGVATLAEVFGYFIPWFDNLLDSAAIPLAALAGTAVMVSTLTGMDPVITWTLAIIAGGGTATAIKGAAAGTRLTSYGNHRRVGQPGRLRGRNCRSYNDQPGFGFGPCTGRGPGYYSPRLRLSHLSQTQAGSQKLSIIR